MPSSESQARREWLRRGIRNASIFMLFIYVAQFLLNVAVFDYPDSSFSIPFSLGVAYCGIIGSQRLNREILSCFYVWCVGSIFIYFINSLLHARELVLLSQGETRQDITNPKNRAVYLYVALGLESILALSQAFAGYWGRELVKDHLVVQFPNRTLHRPTFTIEFVQDRSLSNIVEQAAYEEEKRRTIAALPVIKYELGMTRSDLLNNKRQSTGAQKKAISENQVSFDLQEKKSEQQSEQHQDPGEGAERASHQPFQDSEAELCVICQEEFHENEFVKVLPCKHFYHQACVDSWLDRNLSCPMCVQPVPLIDGGEYPGITTSHSQQPHSQRNVNDFVAIV